MVSEGKPRVVQCSAAVLTHIFLDLATTDPGTLQGLRIHDNPALLEACRNAQHVYPVFIIDPFFLQKSEYRVSVNRYNFLLESLKDLNSSFQHRGSRLLVLRGKPEEVLPKVFQDWNIQQLCFEIDTEPYALKRDAAISALAATAGVEVASFVSHTLYDTAELVRKNGGKAPVSMQSFIRLIDKVGAPLAPAPAPPDVLPPPAPGLPGSSPEETAVPTWQEMGFSDAPTTIFAGGETAALARLEASLQDTKWVAGFEKPSTDPSAFLRPATTVLSPYLKFGCLSARLFHQRLMEVYRQHKQHSQPPVSLRGQLLWREFFYTVGAATPNFNRMAGNPLCKQIDWVDNEEFLAAWREARTGFPWIDAIMTQLRQWGWMHHLARHSVACFLTRGDLYVSWERGQEVFEEMLIDQDYFLNSANWMWLSASGFFNQYFRVYSPVTFGKKYDPHGNFVREFLPILKNLPDKYIYEPWTAPLDVQQRAKCIIGRDYPRPIVDHATASKSNMARMKAAYEANRAAGQGETGDEAPPDAGAPAASQPRGPGPRSRKAAVGPSQTTLETAVKRIRRKASEAMAAPASIQGSPPALLPTPAAGWSGPHLGTSSGHGAEADAASRAQPGAAGGSQGGTDAAVGGRAPGAGLVAEGRSGRGKRQRTLAEMGMARTKGTAP